LRALLSANRAASRASDCAKLIDLLDLPMFELARRFLRIAHLCNKS